MVEEISQHSIYKDKSLVKRGHLNLKSSKLN